MSEKPLMDPWVGQTLRKYRKQKGWVQEELGQKLAQVLASKSGRKDKGLSKSAISRIEKNTFIPPQSKLEILIDLLEITNPEEQKKLFEACGYRSPDKALISPAPREKQLLQKLQEQDWPDKAHAALEWVSLQNQEQHFNLALEKISELQLSLAQAKNINADLKLCLEALLNSKQQRALYGLQPRQETLNLCLEWSNIALKHCHKNFPMAELWEFEGLRCRISAQFLSYQKHLSILNSPENTELFLAVQNDLERAKTALQASDAPQSERIYRQLYLQREAASLQVKHLEQSELKQQQAILSAHLPEKYLSPKLWPWAIAQLKAPQKELALAQLFHLNSELWKNLAAEATHFFEQHQALIDVIQSPQDLPRVPLVNTALLYAVALTRCQRHPEAQQLLASLFLMCNAHTLPNWYYIQAYCAAWRYHETPHKDTANTLISAWARWSESRIDEPQRYNIQRFQACLSEPIIWASMMHLKADKTYMQWLQSKFKTALSQLSHELKDKDLIP